MCSNTDNLQTDDQKDEITNGLASSTTGGSGFNPDSIRKILAMINFLINQQQTQSTPVRRRRRSATPQVIKELSPDEVSELPPKYGSRLATSL